MGSTVQANDGAMLPLDSIAVALTYSGSFPLTATVIYQGNTYVQTFANNGTNIISISNWVNPDYPPVTGVEMVYEDDTTLMVYEDGITVMVYEAA